MNPNQALWEKGDFTRIATSMRESGAALFTRHHQSGRPDRTTVAATFRCVTVSA